jgi:sugar lactone lactonase YvrE
MKRALVLALLSLAIAAPATAAPAEYLFPPTQKVFPEGISLRPGTETFYVSSTANGAIYRGTLGKSQLKVFLPPGANGRAVANGVRASRDHLVVAGSVTGYIFIYDLPSGRFVRRFATGSGGLINDVAITPNGDVYATDSNRGLVFRVPAKALSKRTAATKRLNPFVRVKDTPIGGYANGIVSAGQRYLLVVGLASGVLGRIDLETKRVKAVEGVTFPAGDGLARAGQTLYGVNSGSRITQVKLSRDWLRGTLVRQITSPTFHLPTTMQIVGKRLLVVNSQFDKRTGTPTLPFTVSAVRRP